MGQFANFSDFLKKNLPILGHFTLHLASLSLALLLSSIAKIADVVISTLKAIPSFFSKTKDSASTNTSHRQDIDNDVEPLLMTDSTNAIEIITKANKSVMRVSRSTDNSDKQLRSIRRYFENGEALLAVASQGDIGIVKFLLHMKYDPNIRDANGNTPIMLAASLGHAGIVKEFCSLAERLGINLNAKNRNGKTALIMATIEDHLSIVEELVKKPQTNLDIQERTGKTALMISISKGYHGITDLLLEKKACVKIVDTKNHSALTLAADKHNYQLMTKLIKQGANPSTLINGELVLNWAKKHPTHGQFSQEDREILCRALEQRRARTKDRGWERPINIHSQTFRYLEYIQNLFTQPTRIKLKQVYSLQIMMTHPSSPLTLRSSIKIMTAQPQQQISLIKNYINQQKTSESGLLRENAHRFIDGLFKSHDGAVVLEALGIIKDGHLKRTPERFPRSLYSFFTHWKRRNTLSQDIYELGQLDFFIDYVCACLYYTDVDELLNNDGNLRASFNPVTPILSAFKDNFEPFVNFIQDNPQQAALTKRFLYAVLHSHRRSEANPEGIDSDLEYTIKFLFDYIKSRPEKYDHSPIYALLNLVTPHPSDVAHTKKIAELFENIRAQYLSIKPSEQRSVLRTLMKITQIISPPHATSDVIKSLERLLQYKETAAYIASLLEQIEWNRLFNRDGKPVFYNPSQAILSALNLNLKNLLSLIKQKPSSREDILQVVEAILSTSEQDTSGLNREVGQELIIFEPSQIKKITISLLNWCFYSSGASDSLIAPLLNELTKSGNNIDFKKIKITQLYDSYRQYFNQLPIGEQELAKSPINVLLVQAKKQKARCSRQQQVPVIVAVLARLNEEDYLCPSANERRFELVPFEQILPTLVTLNYQEEKSRQVPWHHCIVQSIPRTITGLRFSSGSLREALYDTPGNLRRDWPCIKNLLSQWKTSLAHYAITPTCNTFRYLSNTPKVVVSQTFKAMLLGVGSVIIPQARGTIPTNNTQILDRSNNHHESPLKILLLSHSPQTQSPQTQSPQTQSPQTQSPQTLNRKSTTSPSSTR